MRAPLFILAIALAPLPAFSQEPPAARPPALTRMLDCRAITAPEQRLACFDREVAAFQAAETARELVVLDRQELRRTRRGLFGLTLPSLGIFGDGGADDPEVVNEIESTLRGISQDRYGKYTFVLADGSRWVQIDTMQMPLEPRAGNTIRIRRAAMGSYLANVQGQRAVRVRRER